MAVTRETVIAVANEWLGKKESDGSFKIIIDTYNDYFEKNGKKYPRGVKLDYKTAWCAGFVSAVAIKAGAADIIPLEISCGKMVELAQQMGIWVEDDNYDPNIGDIVLYDWQDDGKGDNTGWPDHVGYVQNITKTTKNMTIIEGNCNDQVKTRKIKVGDRYIRGYIVPKYEQNIAPVPDQPKEVVIPPAEPPKEGITYTVKKGDTLSKIAKEYGLTVKMICEWNPDIKDPNLIRVGQVLKLYDQNIKNDNNVSDNKPSTGSGNVKYKVNVNSVLNIRNTPVEQPDGKNIVGKLTNGTIVEVSAVNAGWATLADGRGFCCMAKNGATYLIRV